MEAFIIMLRKVVMFVGLAIPGFALVKAKMLKQEQSAALSKILTTVAMFFFIMTSTINNVKFDASSLGVIGVSAIIGIGYTVILFLLSKPLSFVEGKELAQGELTKEVKEWSDKKRGMLRFCSIFSNNGFLGIPLALEVFDAITLSTHAIMVLIIINIITNLAMLTLGDYAISGGTSKLNVVKILTNPVVLGFAIGAVINITGVHKVVPEVLSFTTHFSNLVTPISMTILGMKMGSVDLKKVFTFAKMYYAASIKLIATPVIIIAILYTLNALGVQIVDKYVMLGTFIAFAMPTAGLASPLADKNKGDIEGSVVYTLGSTILSVATIPLLYMLLNMII